MHCLWMSQWNNVAHGPAAILSILWWIKHNIEVEIRLNFKIETQDPESYIRNKSDH